MTSNPAPILSEADRLRIADNLAAVRDVVAAAAARSGRGGSDVTLVAVTKTVDAASVRALYDAGARDFGENRVADGLAKIAALASGAPDARWHLIGHLQRNKAAVALSGFRRLHGVESPKLVEALAVALAKLGGTAEILLEVNVAGEDSKYGVAPSALPALLETALQRPALRVRGLMTMAPFTERAETSRPVFAKLRELRDAMAARFGVELPELSMGMSGDYAVAVEEGATLVRVGTALFR